MGKFFLIIVLITPPPAVLNWLSVLHPGQGWSKRTRVRPFWPLVQNMEILGRPSTPNTLEVVLNQLPTTESIYRQVLKVRLREVNQWSKRKKMALSQYVKSFGFLLIGLSGRELSISHYRWKLFVCQNLVAYNPDQVGLNRFDAGFLQPTKVRSRRRIKMLEYLFWLRSLAHVLIQLSLSTNKISATVWVDVLASSSPSEKASERC